MSILKTNFKQSLSFESFLSKNFIQVSKNGNKIFCPFYDIINILSFDNGIKHSIGKDGMDDIVSCFTIKNEENIIVAYKNGLIRLWDVCKNECLRSWKTFTLTPICAMSMDDLTQSFLAFGTTTNGLIKIYDVENGYYTHQFKQIGAGGVSNITFQYDSELKEIVCVIAACENHSIYVWPLNSEDSKSKSTKNSFRFCLTSHTAQITGLVVLHECQKLISCAQDRLIILWDLIVGRPLKLFQTKASLCAGISLLPNQFSNVSSIEDKIDTNDFNNDNDLQHKYSLITIDANSDLVCWCLQLFSSSDNTKSISDDDTVGDNIAIKDPYKLSRIYETNLLDQYMAATSCDFDKRNVDINDQIDNMKMEQDSTNANINREKVADALQPVYSCYNHATQKFFIVNHQKDIACFDVRNKRWAQRFVGEIEEICALKLMKYPECLDGTNTSFGIQALMAIADNTPQIKIFEMPSFECKLTLYGHSENVLVLATVPNHPDILVSASKDNSIIVWKIEVCPNNTDSFQYQILETLYGHTNAVTALSCFKSPGDSFFTIASCSSDHTLKRWDITLNSIPSITSNSNKKIKKKKNKNLKNENLTLNNNNNNNMENLVSHKKTNFYVCSFTIVAHEKAINCVAIEPRKAKYIATGSMDKTIKIWDFSNGTLISTLNGHKRGVWDLTFSHQILVSGSGDFSIKLWSLTDFSCLKTLEGHSAPVLKLDFLSNAMAKDSVSKQIISCSSDGIFKLWTLGNEDCVTLKNGHDGKVWAFDLDPTGSNAYFVSAGAVDGKIIVWKDATSEELQEIKSKKDSQIYGNQELSNLIKQKVFNERVVQLTTELEDRDSLIKSIQTALETHQFNFTSLQTIIKNMDSAHLDTLLRFIVHWNTNSRTCHVAQLFLNAILRSIHPQSLARLPNITSTIQAILPYSDRHFDRLSKLYQDSSYLEYLANCACIQPVLLS